MDASSHGAVTMAHEPEKRNHFKTLFIPYYVCIFTQQKKILCRLRFSVIVVNEHVALVTGIATHRIKRSRMVWCKSGAFEDMQKIYAQTPTTKNISNFILSGLNRVIHFMVASERCQFSFEHFTQAIWLVSILHRDAAINLSWHSDMHLGAWLLRRFHFIRSCFWSAFNYRAMAYTNHDRRGTLSRSHVRAARLDLSIAMGFSVWLKCFCSRCTYASKSIHQTKATAKGKNASRIYSDIVFVCPLAETINHNPFFFFSLPLSFPLIPLYDKLMPNGARPCIRKMTKSHDPQYHSVSFARTLHTIGICSSIIFHIFLWWFFFSLGFFPLGCNHYSFGTNCLKLYACTVSTRGVGHVAVQFLLLFPAPMFPGPEQSVI